MLEVNFACIGASVPVFWPVFRGKIDAIFVTREVNISIADRDSSNLHMQRLDSQDGDGSRGLWNGGSSELPQSNHYRDTYTIEQVDPLRKKVTVETSVTTGDRGA